MAASNVFGKPITVLDYADRDSRASAALSLVEADDKHKQVKEYVDGLKSSFGDGISVLGMVYNATGENIYYSTSHDWYGRLYDEGGSPYPKIIQNGQWGGFLHTKTPGSPSGSEAAVVFRAKAESGNAEVVFAWDNSWAPGSDNHVYTEIAETGHFGDSAWGDIYSQIDSKSRAESSFNLGLYSSVNITQDSTAYLDALINWQG